MTPGFEIDDALTEWRAVFVGLLYESQAYPGRLVNHTRNQIRTEVLHESLAGSQRESSHELGEIRLHRRT